MESRVVYFIPYFKPTSSEIKNNETQIPPHIPHDPNLMQHSQ